MIEIMKGITYSFISGLLAATASLCGKFSMATDRTLYLCAATTELLQEQFEILLESEHDLICQNVIIWVRIGFFLAMILCNAFMWTMFTKALNMCATSVEASITNTAANFLFTAIYGQMCFDESLGLIWWMGTSLIIAGLMLMHRCSSQQYYTIKRKRS